MFFERALEFFTFRYDFVAYALGAAVLVGLICALVGTFLVLRGFSLMGDAVGHATLPGVAGAFLITGQQHPAALLTGALVSAVLASLTVSFFSRGPRVRSDAAIGIVLSVFFGIGIVLLATIQASATGAQAGLTNFLFGNAAAITAGQLWVLLGVGILLFAVVILFYRPLALMTFDEGYARSIGINTGALEVGLLAALAIAVVISIQAVGVILVAAMLIIPPSAGRFLSKSLPGVIFFAMAIGALSGAFGSMTSYIYEGVATGPAMVLVAAAIFMISFFFGPQGGLLGTWFKRRTGKLVAAREGEI